MRTTGLGKLGVIWVMAVLMGTGVGCDRLREDRAAAEQRKQAQDAIAAYSEASKNANGLHHAIMEAFGRANASTNLQDYRTALRDEVLPAMERFQARLEAMPTGTPELKAVHVGLSAAYKQAIDEIRVFVRDLRAPDDLRAFSPIRDRLQQKVNQYNRDLEAYYRSCRRELRFQGGELASSPAAATPTTAP